MRRDGGEPQTSSIAAALHKGDPEGRGLTYRPATPDEAPLLTEIAHASKRHWGYPEEWIAEWTTALTLSPEFISDHPVIVAERQGEVVGFFALEERDSCWFLEHLWLRPDQIGKGFGARLFDHAVSVVRSVRPGSVFIDSDPNAEGFYLKMGARRVGSILGVVGGAARTLPRLEFIVVP